VTVIAMLFAVWQQRRAERLAGTVPATDAELDAAGLPIRERTA
jgi:hypothetical protein